jgi:hypothetical protein
MAAMDIMLFTNQMMSILADHCKDGTVQESACQSSAHSPRCKILSWHATCGDEASWLNQSKGANLLHVYRRACHELGLLNLLISLSSVMFIGAIIMPCSQKKPMQDADWQYYS